MGEPLAVNLAVDQSRRQILSGGLDPFGNQTGHQLGQLVRGHEQLGPDVDPFDHVLLILTAQDGVRLLEHHPPVLSGYTHHLADDLQREPGRHLGHKVAGTALEEVVDDLLGDAPHRILQGGQTAGCEPGRHDGTQPSMPRVVHRDHRTEVAGQLGARKVNRRCPAVAATEVLGPPARLDHVGVAN